MLFDAEQFSKVEEILNDNGIITQFEQENGIILGRMMISVTDVPQELSSEVKITSSAVAFCGSFDFYDSSIGIVLNPETKEVISGIWITNQSVNAEAPAREWIEFFVRILISNIHEDGTFTVPMYTFISDVGDFTVVPTP